VASTKIAAVTILEASLSSENKGGDKDLLHTTPNNLRSDLFSFLLKCEVKRSLRYQNFMTLLILEPDRRPQSLETLETLATLIRNSIRETDFMTRIDDAEFAIVLLESNLDGAYIIASRIVDHISSYRFDHEEVQYLTVSIGGACFPTTSPSLETSDLLKQAKNALKIAKKERNRVHLPGLPVSQPLENRVEDCSAFLF